MSSVSHIEIEMRNLLKTRVLNGSAKCIASLMVLMLSLLWSQMTAAADGIKVYAAASMTNVVDELALEYKKLTGTSVVSVYAGSSSLARQIIQGAPADVFISANTDWMDFLVSEGVVVHSDVKQLARNELVLVTPYNSPIEPFNMADSNAWLAGLQDSRIAIGQPESVPAGIYAKQALEKSRVWQAISRKTAQSNSVRAALALVERGEALLGVVYKTDALVNDKVKIIGVFPDADHSPIIYPVVDLRRSPESKAFVDFLLSDQAQLIFGRYGFK